MNAALLIRGATSLFLLSVVASAQVDWVTVAGFGAPTAFNCNAWDSVRNRLVAFGGEASLVLNNTTTEWTGSAWTVLNPALRPTARTRAAMAYDGARQVSVLFGGSLGAGSFSNQTWTWNGTNWTQASPASAPSVRSGAAMAYDSARQLVVLFGGFVPAGTDTGDTWEWNGVTWTQRFPVGPTPPARGAHRMVYDASRGVSVMCGGYSTPGQGTVADAWTWNGTAWTQLTSLPGTLCDQLLAYDAARERVVSWGGLRIVANTTFTNLNQAYEWRGAGWTLRSTSTVPSARSASAHAYDALNNRVLMGGGGINTGTQFSDTLAYTPIIPGSMVPFGSGCPSSAGTVQLNGLSLPYIGSNFVQQIANAPLVSFVGIIAFGFSNTLWGITPLPLDLGIAGAPGCPLNVSPDVTAAVLLIGGSGTVTWSVPNQGVLVGQSVFTQAVVLDPLSPLPFQIGVSSGRTCTIGSP